MKILPLYGRLSFREQEAVFRPSAERKVILATSIAETSLTIPGVTAVVDAGWERRPRFNRHSGLTRLETCRVSQASADQRMGRAGRVREGLCFRLWSRGEQGSLTPFREPEIRSADLSSLLLETLLWGCDDPEGLPWLEAPPKGSYYQARELLTSLGALGAAGGLSPLGREMAGLGLSPRLARLVAEGRRRGEEQTACLAAALLSEGDWMNRRGDSDLLQRVDRLRQGRDKGHPRVKSILRLWESLLREKARPERLNPGILGELLIPAFPDRVARRQEERRYHLSGGGGCALSEGDPLQGQEFLLVLETGGAGGEPRIFFSLGLSKEEVLREAGPGVTEKEELRWDGEKERMRARRVRRLGALVLSETPLAEPGSRASSEEFRAALRKRGLGLLPWKKEDRLFRNRCRFAAAGRSGRDGESWPRFDDEALIDSVDIWFFPLLTKGRLTRPLREGLGLLLDWRQRQDLDKNAPERLTVPSGSRLQVDYSDPEQPALDVRIQELFGLGESPRIGGIPLLIRLLNPAGRPIQMTRDLQSFWGNTYPEVRKELRGRYPKHYWPEDPYAAVPTSRVRPPR